MATPEPQVEAKVKIVPAKRRATFDVEVPDRRVGRRTIPGRRITAAVNRDEVVFSTNGKGYYSYLPKTLEAVDATLALFEAVRAELVEQGVES